MAEGPQYDATVTNWFYARIATGDGSGSSSANKRAFSSYATDSASSAMAGHDAWLYYDATPTDLGAGIVGGSGSSSGSRPHRLMGCNTEPGDLSADLSDGVARPVLQVTSGTGYAINAGNGAVLANLRATSTSAASGFRSVSGMFIACDVSTASGATGFCFANGAAIYCRAVGSAVGLQECRTCYGSWINSGSCIGSTSNTSATRSVLLNSNTSWNAHTTVGCLQTGVPSSGAQHLQGLLAATSGNPLSTKTNLILGEMVVCRTSGNTVATATASSDGIDLGGNLDLPIAPFRDLANGDLRLSAAGRAVPRIVHFMQQLPREAMFTGWQMDTPEVLAHYAAQLSGYGRGLSNPWAR